MQTNPFVGASIRHAIVGAAFAILPLAVHGQLMTLQPGSAGSITMGTRVLGAGGGGLVFDDGGALNANFGRLVDPGNGGFGNGNNFQAINALRGGANVGNSAGPLVPGLNLNVPRGPDGAGNPNNFGPGRMDLFANNNGIWTTGNWALADPKAAGLAGDGSMITATGDAVWRANANLTGLNFGLGMGFRVNIGAAGNYCALGVTGAYRVQPAAGGAFGAWNFFTPITYAGDGPGGAADFINAGQVSGATPFLRNANAADDRLAYNTWGFSSLRIGQGANADIRLNDKVEFKVFFTAFADPDADVDFDPIASADLPGSDFGNNFQPVPEPGTYALGAGLALASFGVWRKARRNS
ncbi:MAG TPA: hypothetical protein VMF06_07040 [Candidatus Limnocylindria bacterium]|jgi:hypothetical protein|nr:hypothetical protein [Candidatus Limnocylindria bacterium]